jgi:hypothetical protein
MPIAAESLQAAAVRFSKNARECFNLELDGSLKSLVLAAGAMQRYHAMYERAVAAKDPNLEKFVQQVSTEATAYVSMVFIKSHEAKLGATKEGKLMLIAGGVNIPILDMMVEEVRTGRAHSLLLIPQLDAISKKNLEPRTVDPGNLEAEARAAAAIAVQDVRASLKQDLDYSPESLAIVDRALQRLKAIAEVSPESKSNLVRASCEKYGSYIGEVLVKHRGGKWLKIQVRDTVMNAVGIGAIYAMPALIVQAVLEGKKLDMGEKAAETVVQFAAFTQDRMQNAAPEGLFQNLDTPGEILKKIKLLAEEGVRTAKASHGVDLDYSLFSLSALDDVIEKHRKKIESERNVLNEENFQRARAFSSLPLGAYLGEVILRGHGGCWEDGDPWPRLRQHMMKFDPITVVGAFFRGENATATEKMHVASSQQYYQGIRPLLHDIVEAKLYGPGGKMEQLLAQMGPNLQLNIAILNFADSCLAFSYAECNVELDFSEKSLLDVDRMLEQFHKNTEEEIKAKPALDRANLVNLFGSYAGEVFRRALGGVWANDASGALVTDPSGEMRPGPNVAHLAVGGTRVFVVTKVRRFLEHGSGDSLAFMLHSFRTLIERGEITAGPAQ